MIVVPAPVELPTEHPLAAPVGEFLADLVNTGCNPHTVRGYRGDLAGFAAADTGGVGEITVAVLVGVALQSLTFSPRSTDVECGKKSDSAAAR